MPRVEVTAAKDGCLYDSVPHPAGEVFDCDLDDAVMLRRIGKVEFDETAKPVKAEETPKRLKADGSPDRRYRRRDMQAED